VGVSTITLPGSDSSSGSQGRDNRCNSNRSEDERQFVIAKGIRSRNRLENTVKVRWGKVKRNLNLADFAKVDGTPAAPCRLALELALELDAKMGLRLWCVGRGLRAIGDLTIVPKVWDRDSHTLVALDVGRACRHWSRGRGLRAIGVLIRELRAIGDLIRGVLVEGRHGQMFEYLMMLSMLVVEK
jgi:hypothetical protein